MKAKLSLGHAIFNSNGCIQNRVGECLSIGRRSSMLRAFSSTISIFVLSDEPG